MDPDLFDPGNAGNAVNGNRVTRRTFLKKLGSNDAELARDKIKINHMILIHVASENIIFTTYKLRYTSESAPKYRRFPCRGTADHLGDEAGVVLQWLNLCI